MSSRSASLRFRDSARSDAAKTSTFSVGREGSVDMFASYRTARPAVLNLRLNNLASIPRRTAGDAVRQHRA
jgi:hypothetical protein